MYVNPFFPYTYNATPLGEDGLFLFIKLLFLTRDTLHVFTLLDSACQLLLSDFQKRVKVELQEIAQNLLSSYLKSTGTAIFKIWDIFSIFS